jgi:hypothetical protein
MKRIHTLDDLVSTTRAITPRHMAKLKRWFIKHMMQRLVNVLNRRLHAML